ncbi:hypothetical protein NEOLI_002562 [Neolecta irregularis DAH-3]|uniref:Uncharacterized protein n=1 Tax=Neolecta irregularis (strain DAH-3) TaxID=1198029 RepID=A0A1U7LPI6_NEOID|nr:hypothetical protein NEOLI_002562 [Neolecta irregularis DAH-3]|eukprot:OLL24564.1 hypothetical protein NEOLI_002562 [Neolecta irregularis DAH-3]
MTTAALPLPLAALPQPPPPFAARDWTATLRRWLFRPADPEQPPAPAPPPDEAGAMLAIQNKPPSLAVRRSQRKIHIETLAPDPADDPAPAQPLTPVQSALARRKELKQLQLKDLAIQAGSPPRTRSTVEEYVHRQRLAKCTGNRDQRFPVAGNNIRPICVGSGYAYA